MHASLRDAEGCAAVKPWVETHGYLHSVAMRLKMRHGLRLGPRQPGLRDEFHGIGVSCNS